MYSCTLVCWGLTPCHEGIGARWPAASTGSLQAWHKAIHLCQVTPYQQFCTHYGLQYRAIAPPTWTRNSPVQSVRNYVSGFSSLHKQLGIDTTSFKSHPMDTLLHNLTLHTPPRRHLPSPKPCARSSSPSLTALRKSYYSSATSACSGPQTLHHTWRPCLTILGRHAEETYWGTSLGSSGVNPFRQWTPDSLSQSLLSLLTLWTLSRLTWTYSTGSLSLCSHKPVPVDQVSLLAVYKDIHKFKDISLNICKFMDLFKFMDLLKYKDIFKFKEFGFAGVTVSSNQELVFKISQWEVVYLSFSVVPNIYKCCTCTRLHFWR